MKLQLIKKEGNYILVSGEKIKEGEHYMLYPSTIACTNFNTFKASESTHSTNTLKVLAGYKGLPSIDFSLLSDEKCKEIGWVDVYKLIDKAMEEIYPLNIPSFKYGFKTAQSLNDKQFSLEDMKKAMDLHKNTSIEKEEIIQSLQQPKVWEVEVGMEDFIEEETGHELKWTNKRVKVINNAIKITKIL